MIADSVPSPWVERWAHLIAAKGRVLDVAAGSGRHTRFLAARGHPVTAIDCDAAAIAPLAEVAEIVVADLEQDPWPLGQQAFAAIVVTHYLWRPLMPFLKAALAPGGVLICETFAAGNETVGRPRNPAFLLASGELLTLAEGLRIVAYEDGFLAVPERFVQRIVAVAPDLDRPLPRFTLNAANAPDGSVESRASQGTT